VIFSSKITSQVVANFIKRIVINFIVYLLQGGWCSSADLLQTLAAIRKENTKLFQYTLIITQICSL